MQLTNKFISVYLHDDNFGIFLTLSHNKMFTFAKMSTYTVLKLCVQGTKSKKIKLKMK